IPPITASSFFSFATSREVRSKRFITLVLRIAVLMDWLAWDRLFVEHLAAGEQRREDQRHRRLRGDGLLDRAIDDELGFLESCDGVMLHGERVQHWAHGAADKGLAVVELAEGAALGYEHDERYLIGHCQRSQHVGQRRKARGLHHDRAAQATHPGA